MYDQLNSMMVGEPVIEKRAGASSGLSIVAELIFEQSEPGRVLVGLSADSTADPTVHHIVS